MTLDNADASLRDSSGRTVLYRAAQDGHEDAVRACLDSPAGIQGLLNLAETVNGWTPLFVACINGNLSIVKLLLEAGAEQRICDLAGWTEKEHAVFRGHMKVAELLAAHGAGGHRSPASSAVLRMGMVRPGESLKCALQSQTRTASPLEPSGITPNGFGMQRNSSQIFVTLGPSNTRSNLKPVELTNGLFDHSINDSHKTRFGVIIKAGGAKSTAVHCIELPMLRNMINKPLQFFTEDPDNVNLVFEIFRNSSSSDKGIQVIGTAVALLKSLQRVLAPNRESLIRDYTIPILENGPMTYIGSVTFSILIVTPFQPPYPPPRPSSGFWKDDSTQIVGHRGSGANSTARKTLQIGENTVQSFLTATSLGASCVEFDVQLTKDCLPVIFHDFLVMETGGDVPLHTLTIDQFMHLSRSQAPRSDLLSSAEVRYLEKNKVNGGLRPKPRSHSVNTYDDYRSQDLVERMRYTEEGMHNNIKGNLRGHSIQEPSSTLEQLLTELPEFIAFNLEIKHPMLWEAEDRGMELCAMEINFFVDTILTTIFQLCGHRNITLSSFSPEICILLGCKQQTFPILFINKAGSVPAGDVRASSLQGAIEFAKAWNLAGIVMLSDPFVMCPRLLTYAKDSGLVVGSYGNLNDEPECALIQAEAGLDAIMTNKVRLISETLAKAKR
ncbi:Glycerophosphocholine phosphodiesterase [Imshaugia aleurites]|uniref:Glycerophosphocholine phosphodiesterase n=1 Tax=Imshaugia aleurites TaxID=172621 RepID=A0A8H3F9S1_9LECA|nr:Glycerophosphocholine phosphodiesterase [Imshaugia aleurites]